MNSIGHIENKDFFFKANKTAIKKIKKTETDMSFKDHMQKRKMICSCFQLSENDLKDFNNFEEAKNETGCTTRCTACLKDVKNLYEK